MKRLAIVHYDEIALKGKNRGFFERALVDNIQNKLGSEFDVKNSWGRIFVHNIDEVEDKLKEVLSTTPGVATFGLGFSTTRRNLVVEEISEIAIKIAEDTQFESFKISARRADKTFPKTSNELEREVGEIVFEHHKREKRVDLKKPDLEIVVEVLQKEVVVYAKQRSIGGLPVGSSGRAIALLSGGFDSPVAAYMLAKRGVRPVCVHFHGMPKTSPAAVEKVRALACQLARYTGKAELVLVPIVPAMQAIARGAPAKLRIVLLRRVMLQISERLAKRYKASAIITGDSVGQVASQTLENLYAVGSATALPVLRPLCGFNKLEIIELAKEVGTHDISVKPHDDTCSMFVPDKPETRAKMEEVLEAEKTYNVEEIIEAALTNMESENCT